MRTSAVTGRLQLYIARAAPNSDRAEQNLGSALNRLEGKGAELGLEVIDVHNNAKRAMEEGIFVTPTLVGRRVTNQLTMVGDLGDTEKLDLFLQVLRDDVALSSMRAEIGQKDKSIASNITFSAELHHRIRNNFHVIQQMIVRIDVGNDSNSLALITAINHRLVAMSTMHDQFLHSDTSQGIDLGGYIAALCDVLPSIQPPGHVRNIKLECSVTSVRATLDTVTVIGMVLAESVSNSFKHAFPTGEGVVGVSLRTSDTALEAVLMVTDNGIGFEPSPESKRHGVGLVRRMMQQLDGTAELSCESGTSWTFRFPLKPISDAGV